LTPEIKQKLRVVSVCGSRCQVVNSEVAAITIDSNVSTVHFSITGRSWAMLRKYFPELVPKVFYTIFIIY